MELLTNADSQAGPRGVVSESRIETLGQVAVWEGKAAASKLAGEAVQICRSDRHTVEQVRHLVKKLAGKSAPQL